MEVKESTLEPLPTDVESHTETTHGGAAPVSQTTNLYPQQSVSPDAMGITGFAARVAGVSILAIFMAVYIIDRYDERSSKQRAYAEQREDKAREREELKEDRKLRTEQVDKAHKDFQEQSSKQWEEVRKNNEATKQLGEEVKKMGTALDMSLRTLTDEVKKKGMGGP